MLDTALTILEPIWFASDDILISCILLFLTSILFSWVYQFLHGYLALNALISEGVYTRRLWYHDDFGSAIWLSDGPGGREWHRDRFYYAPVMWLRVQRSGDAGTEIL